MRQKEKCSHVRLCLVYLLTYYCSFTSGETQQSLATCSFDLKQDLSTDKLPLLLKSTKGEITLITPENMNDRAVINLLPGEELLVVCTGDGNKIEKIDEHESNGTCARQNKILFENSTVIPAKNIECERRITAETKETTQKCGPSNAGKIYEIGYKAYGWQTLFTVCHDPKSMDTYYSKHTLYGSIINGRVTNVQRPSDFQKGNNLYINVDIKKLYTKENQQSVLRKILGAKATSKYLNTTEYLARGHLSPDADMVMAGWKFATYFYINVAPQWQSINGGNWVEVETSVRTLASNLRDNLIIITGTWGVLKLEGDKAAKELYLGYPEEIVRVPEFFYKVVHQPSTKKAIVIVISNNPYLEDKKSTAFCDDICSKYKWKVDKNVENGYAFCCTVDSFRKTVKGLPNLNVDDVLEFTGKPKALMKFRNAVEQIVEQNRRRRRNADRYEETPSKESTSFITESREPVKQQTKLVATVIREIFLKKY